MPSGILNRGLARFRNSKDEDIENFLKNSSLNFEERHWCSSYFLVDTDKLVGGELYIEGFFTLSNKVLTVPDEIPRALKKKLFRGIIRPDMNLPVILIGQLGKHVDDTLCEYGNTTMEELLDMAFEIIDEIVSKIPYSCVLLECKQATDSSDEKRIHLHQKYTDYGFMPLSVEGGLVQYVILV